MRNLPQDGYIYYFIGRHLKKSNEVKYFPDLFLDFKFLENKMRCTSLPSTVGDLDTYRDEIIGTDITKRSEREELLDDITTFLQNIEEMIVQSNRTNLLQYAINYSDSVRVEAIKQARTYKNRLWLRDIDHTHKQRQIIQLPKNGNIIRFADPNIGLIALEDSQILLKDLSSVYTVESTLYQGHTKPTVKIIDMIKLSDQHFLSLDANGNVKVWSLVNTPTIKRHKHDNIDRTISRRRQSQNESVLTERKSVQNITNSKSSSKITTVYYSNNKVFFGTETGHIDIYKYEPTENDDERPLNHETHLFANIMNLVKIQILFNSYLMVVNIVGVMKLYYLGDSGIVAYNDTDWIQYPSPINIHYCDQQFSNIVNSRRCLFVYKNNITCVEFKITSQKLMNITSMNINKKLDKFKDIQCSVMTSNFKYLIVGTSSGTIIYDCTNNSEVHRIGMNNSIQSLDVIEVYPDINTVEYLFMTTTSKSDSLINLHGFENYHNSDELQLCESKTIESTYLCGRRLYDFSYNMENDEIILYAVDSRYNVHRKSSNDEFTRSIVIGSFLPKIAGISTNRGRTIVGFYDGSVKELSTLNIICQFSTPVSYLKQHCDGLVIAGSNSSFIVINPDHKKSEFSGQAVISYMMGTKFLVVVKSDCSFDVIRISDHMVVCYKTMIDNYGASDMSGNVLFIGTQRSIICIIQFKIDDNGVTSEVQYFSKDKDSIAITSLCLSMDRQYFAVGYKNGLFIVYKASKDMKTHEEIFAPKYTYRSDPIKVLRFSPWNDSRLPLILLTVSSEIRFWNVRHSQAEAIPFKGLAIKRHRFSSKNNNKQELSVVAKNESNNNLMRDVNPWLGKVGNPEDVDLLSCIKLIGNSVDQFFCFNNFTKFVSIDDDGNIYYLRVQEFDKDETVTGVEEHDSSKKDENGVFNI